MNDLSIDEIFEILDQHAGLEDGQVLGPNDADTTFTDLGFDSLAVLELIGQLERRRGIRLPENATELATTATEVQQLVRSVDAPAVS